jgi:peroxiredoxin family protein
VTEGDKKMATILLVSGELDKAIVALEVACAMAAMGKQVNMWFVLYGINVIKKPASIFSSSKWKLSKNRSPGRTPETDVTLQRMIRIVNHDGADNLPLSQCNFFGLGPRILRFVMQKKGSPAIYKLLEDAKDLGVVFKICQPCVDVLALDVERDLLINAEVSGVSTYVLDTDASHYNAVF